MTSTGFDGQFSENAYAQVLYATYQRMCIYKYTSSPYVTFVDEAYGARPDYTATDKTGAVQTGVFELLTTDKSTVFFKWVNHINSLSNVRPPSMTFAGAVLFSAASFCEENDLIDLDDESPRGYNLIMDLAAETVGFLNRRIPQFWVEWDRLVERGGRGFREGDAFAKFFHETCSTYLPLGEPDDDD